MAKITNKVSIYGDSMRVAPSGGSSTAARLLLNPKFSAGVNDFAVGGTTFWGHHRGYTGTGASNPGTLMWGGLDFAGKLTVDDCDICVVSLGGNDQPAGIVAGTHTPVVNLGNGTYVQNFVGSDFLQIAADCLVMVQTASAAGKRPVLVGLPYVNETKLLASGGGIYGADVFPTYTTEQRTSMAHGLVLKFEAVNAAVRIVSGLQGVPIIVPYGSPIAPNMVVPSTSSVIDGVHPTVAYSNDISDWIGTEIVRIFSL